MFPRGKRNINILNKSRWNDPLTSPWLILKPLWKFAWPYITGGRYFTWEFHQVRPPDQIQKPKEAITFHSVVILPGVSITNKSKRDIEEERGGSLPRYRGDSRERSNEQTKTRKPQEIAFGRALKASRECRWKSGRVHTVHVQTEPGKFSRATPRNYSLR